MPWFACKLRHLAAQRWIIVGCVLLFLRVDHCERERNALHVGSLLACGTYTGQIMQNTTHYSTVILRVQGRLKVRRTNSYKLLFLHKVPSLDDAAVVQPRAFALILC